MGAILLIFLALWGGSAYLGVRLLVRVLRPPLDPEIPPARVANPAGAAYAYQKTTDLAVRGTRKLGKTIGTALGVVLIIWPILVAYWFFTTDFGFGGF